MILRWPFSWASKQAVIPPQPLPVPSTQEVLARALARSGQRGHRVARWRIARRWCYYHAWRHGLPVVLAVLAPSSQLWPPGSKPIAAQQEPPTLPEPAAPAPVSTEAALTLRPATWSSANTALVPVDSTAPAPEAVLEPTLKTDTSLHSQEP
jgi:hypothetical protein